MCFGGSPSIPPPAAPVAPPAAVAPPEPVAPPAKQEVKAPQQQASRNADAAPGGGVFKPMGSTLLTGPSGVAKSALNLGGKTLLGE